MAITFSASTTNLIYAGADITAYPCTIACWARPASFPVSSYIAGFGRNSSTVPLMYLFVGTNGIIHAQYRNDASSILTTDASSALSANTWYHLAATFGSGGTDQTQYINGAQNGTSGQPPSGAITLDRTGISKRIGVSNSYFNGRISEVGFWNVKLTADEIKSLGQGVSPLLIRPQNLINYLPLHNHQATNQVEWMRARAYVVGGSLSIGDGPPNIIMPQSGRILLPTGITHNLNSLVGTETTVGSAGAFEIDPSLIGGSDSEVGYSLTEEVTSDPTNAVGLDTTVGQTLTETVDTSPEVTVGSDTVVGSSQTADVTVSEEVSQGLESESGYGLTVDTEAGVSPSSGSETTVGYTVTETVDTSPSVSVGLDTTVGQSQTVDTSLDVSISSGAESTVGSAVTEEVTADASLIAGVTVTVGQGLSIEPFVGASTGLSDVVGQTASSEVTAVVEVVQGPSDIIAATLTSDDSDTLDLLVGSDTTVGQVLTETVDVSIDLLVGGETTVGLTPTVDAQEGTAVAVEPSTGLSVISGYVLTEAVDASAETSVGSSVSVGQTPTSGAEVEVALSGGLETSGGSQPTIEGVVHPSAAPSVGLETSVGNELTFDVVADVSVSTGSDLAAGLDLQFAEVVPGPPKPLASQAGGVSSVISRLPRFATWEARQPLIEQQQIEVAVEGAPWRAPDLISRQSLDIKSDKIVDLSVYRAAVNGELAQQAEDEEALMAIIQAL